MTIKDLAALTGYSIGTVSRALNGHPHVSPKARIAILDAAKKHGFQFNPNAKNLKQQRSNAIIAVVKGTSNELFGSLIEVIQTLVSRTPYALVVDYIDEDANEVRRAASLCREKKPRGVLFLGGNQDNFRSDFCEIDVPSVLVTNSAQQLAFENLSSVTSDDYQGGLLAVEHLASLGHRKFVVIGGNRQVSDITGLRYRGCMEGFKRNNISFDEENGYEDIRFSYQDGYCAMKHLLERGADFTALFAMADVIAIGAIRALRDAGKRVPEDVSVVGFDGLEIGTYAIPRLDTIVQDVEKLASRSVQILLEQIRGETTCYHETIPVAVQWRESTRQV